MVSALVVAVIIPALAAEPFSRVEFDSLELGRQGPAEPSKIAGYLLEAGSGGVTPGAVFAPACGGLVNNDHVVGPRYRIMAEHLKRLGITSLLVDGFTPRGRTEICTLNAEDRSITTGTRMADSLAGLRYLRARPDINKDIIFLFSWGATGSIEAMNRGGPLVAGTDGRFVASVMFYPNCREPKGSFSPYAPIQILAGDEDTWNPPKYCTELVKREQTDGASVDIKLYPGAYHGFDKLVPPHMMENVNSKVHSAMVGQDPAARKDSFDRIAAFVSRFLPGSPEQGGGEENSFMSEERIREVVAGNTLSFTAPGSGQPLAVFFAMDGTALVKSNGKDSRIFTKRWSVKDGKFLCRTYGRQNENRCARVGETAEPDVLLLFDENIHYKAKIYEGEQLPK